MHVHHLVLAAEEEPDELDEGQEQRVELTGEQQWELQGLLDDYKDVIKDSPGRTSVLRHDVDTGDSPPIRSAPYQVPEEWKEKVKAEIQLLLDTGLIERSFSPWSSPIVPVRKPDGSCRLCVDYRRLNKQTVSDPYYIPMVTELLQRVVQAAYLSKLDLCKGFYQVELTDEAREKSALVTPWGKFQFLRMPFGMKNAPASFQRLMDLVLDGTGDVASAYIDDVIIYSTTREQHLADIRTVLDRLRQAGLTAKPTKCSWGKEVVEYLGHKIGRGRVAVPEDRVEAVRNYKQPRTMRALLGLVGYYRRFVKDFAATAKPLTEATKKTALRLVSWMQSMEEAFHKLCECLSNTCVLTVPTDHDKYLLQTDASLSKLSWRGKNCE